MSGDLATRLAQIQSAIARTQPKAHLLAVSKGQPIEAIADLAALGQRDFAENYVQELLTKIEAAQKAQLPHLRWHFIGHLQSNKISAVLPHIQSLHSIGSLSLAQKIAKRIGDQKLSRLAVFLEVNIDSEETKGGFKPEELQALVPALQALQGELDFRGLMAIPKSPAEGGDSARAFLHLAQLERGLQPLTQGELSMGMSEDYTQALRAGATHIRVGTALFGPRQKR